MVSRSAFKWIGRYVRGSLIARFRIPARTVRGRAVALDEEWRDGGSNLRSQIDGPEWGGG